MRNDDDSDYDPSLTERLLEEGHRRLRESRRLLQDLFGEERGTPPDADDQR